MPALPAASYSPSSQFRELGRPHGYGQVQLPARRSRHACDAVTDFDRNGTAATGRLRHARRGTYWDLDADGYLSDDERDEDADGLTNYEETHGPHDRVLVGRLLPDEKRVTRSPYAGTGLTTPTPTATASSTAPTTRTTTTSRTSWS